MKEGNAKIPTRSLKKPVGVNANKHFSQTRNIFTELTEDSFRQNKVDAQISDQNKKVTSSSVMTMHGGSVENHCIMYQGHNPQCTFKKKMLLACCKLHQVMCVTASFPLLQPKTQYSEECRVTTSFTIQTRPLKTERDNNNNYTRTTGVDQILLQRTGTDGHPPQRQPGLMFPHHSRPSYFQGTHHAGQLCTNYTNGMILEMLYCLLLL